MTDILICGMDKPHNCFQCDLSYLRGERLFCHVIKDEVLRSKIASDCPIIELPEHVDLISRKQAFQMMLDRGYQKEAAGVILEVPTVIPSNKEV